MTIPEADSLAAHSDDELIRLIRGGRSDVYEELVRRYQQDVLRIAGTLLYDRGRTEDLVQEVFVNAYFALPGFEVGMDFGPWIRTIARNAVREELRRRSRYDRRLAVYADMLAAKLDDPAADRRQGTLAESLRRHVGRLPEREAEAIRLRYDEGRPINQIAAVLGSTPGATRNLLCQARSRLREWIQREVDQP